MSNLALKKLYKTGAILQFVLAIVVIVFTFPSFLQLGYNTDMVQWREFVEKVFDSGAKPYIQGTIHGIVFAVFLFNVLAIFVWKGLSNLFFKLSIAVCSFPLAMYSLNFVLFCLGINTEILYWFSQTLLYVFFGVGAALFLIGFLFLILERKAKQSKTTSYVVAKAFFWMILALFNFVAVGALSTAWFGILFAYFGILFPYFLIWMLPALGIWQLICALKMH